MKTILLIILLASHINTMYAQHNVPDSATQAMIDNWKYKQKFATKTSLVFVGLGAVTFASAALIGSNDITSNAPVVLGVASLACFITSAPFGWVAIHYKRLSRQEEKKLRKANISVRPGSVSTISGSQLSLKQQVNLSLHIPLGR